MVHKGVLATAVAEKFIGAHVAEWEALFNFHDKYTTASVPLMPISLPLGSGRYGKMNGMQGSSLHYVSPTPGACARRVACRSRGVSSGVRSKRHARPRGSKAAGTAAVAETGDGTAGAAAGKQPRVVPRPMQKELPLHNSVTGSNFPRADRRAAPSRQAESEVADALEDTLPAGDIEERRLYFIETADNAGEGEFKVGVGRVQGPPQTSGLVPVAWQWYTRKHCRDAAWGSGMALIPYLVRAGERARRVGTSLEDPHHFLPVAVELTGKSVPPEGASIAGSAVRLTKRCVDRVRAFIQSRRPDPMTVVIPASASSSAGRAGQA
jgi:hypothetical protein